LSLKKIVLFAFTIAFINSVANAGIFSDIKPGIEFGGHLTTMSYEKTQPGTTVDWKLTGFFGAYVSKKLTKKLHFRPGIRHIEHGDYMEFMNSYIINTDSTDLTAKIEGENTRYYRYISMPLLVKYHLDDKLTFFFEGGFDIGYLYYAKSKFYEKERIYEGDPSTVEEPSEVNITDEVYDDKNDLNKVHLGFLIGWGYSIPISNFRLNFCFRYSGGIINTNKSNLNNMRTQSIEVVGSVSL
jgi:hypothetical protein